MKKVLLVVLSLVLVAALSVGLTMAYLTSQDAVTNTFTVGNVKITLDETDVDGSKTDVITEGRDKANEYKLIPGHEYVKDPTIHVDAKSEECYLFVKVVNNIADIEDPTATVTGQMTKDGNWTLVSGTTDTYYYKTTVAGGTDVPVFENFKISGSVNNNDLATYTGKTIQVTAYAIQADGFIDENGNGTAADEAWAAAPANFN